MTTSLADALRAVDEPLDLLRRLRRFGADEPAAVRDEAVRLLAQRLWRRWRPILAPFGVGPTAVRNSLQGDDRELLLWVAGDRPWRQLLDGLAGRVVRRAEIATRAGSLESERPAS